MRLRPLLAAAATLLPLAPCAQDAVWVPLDDPVPTFLVDGDRRLSYTSGEQTPGVLVSADGGATWSEVTDGLPANEPASPVYLRGEVAFATTASGRLFRSGDGGRTWTDDTDGLASRRPDDDGTGRRVVDVVPVGSAYLALTPFGAFRSSGDGPWQPASDGLPPYTETGIDFIASGVAAVADTVVLASTLGLYRSVDGGASWSPSSGGFEVSGLPLEGRAVHALGGRFYALADYPNPFGGVYRSDDGGQTWARRSDGIVMQLRDGPVPRTRQPRRREPSAGRHVGRRGAVRRHGRWRRCLPLARRGAVGAVQRRSPQRLGGRVLRPVPVVRAGGRGRRFSLRPGEPVRTAGDVPRGQGRSDGVCFPVPPVEARSRSAPSLRTPSGAGPSRSARRSGRRPR